MGDKDQCEWRETETGQWETECKNIFEFDSGRPSDNDFEYCPYCGKKLKTKGFVGYVLD